MVADLNGLHPTFFFSSFLFFSHYKASKPCSSEPSPRIGRQSKSSMLETKCLTLTALAVTSQTSVVRPMTLSLVLPIINSDLDLTLLSSLSYLTLWSSRLALTCSRLLDSLYIGRVIQTSSHHFARALRPTEDLFHCGLAECQGKSFSIRDLCDFGHVYVTFL